MFLSSNFLGRGSAIVAWCEGFNTVTDIYEVKTKDDFDNCTNLPEYPVHYSQEYEVEGFIVQLTRDVQKRYFVSKSQCKNGFKFEISKCFNCV